MKMPPADVNSPDRFALRSWPLVIGLLALTLGAYAAVIVGPFSPLDDVVMLRNNPSFTPPTWASFVRHLTTTQFSIYMPLTNAVWHGVALAAYRPDLYLGELVPLPFKVLSVSAQAVAAAVAFWMVLPVLRDRWLALFAATVFAVHPVQVEAVGWTTGFKDQLCGIMAFLAAGAYLRFIFERRAEWWRLALLFAVLAVMSKPTGVTVAPVLIACDLLLAKRDWQRRFALLWPFCVISVVGALIAAGIQDGGKTAIAPPLLRPLVALDSLAFYIGKTLWPFGFAVDYGRTYEALRASGALWWTWVVPVAAAALAAMTRDRVLWLGAVLFVVPIVPLLGFVPFAMQQYSNVTDHYAYQSMLGVGLIAARLIGRIRSERAGRTLAAGIVVLLTVLCVRQAMLWQDMTRLMWHNIAINPGSFLAYGNLGVIAFQQGDFIEAERFTRQSIAIRPREASFDQLAQILEVQGRYEEAMASAIMALDARDYVMDVRRVRVLFDIAIRHDNVLLAEKSARRWVLIDPADPRPRQYLRQLPRNSVLSSQPA